jgi:hypothetical protein
MGRAAAAASMRVRRLYDRREIDALLSADRPYAAYALSHLEPEIFERTEFWIAEGLDDQGMVIRSKAAGESLITIGAPSAVASILHLHPGSRASYLSTAAPEHMAAIERWHHVDDPLTMQRMSATRAAFTPIDGVAHRLLARDVHAINDLYALDDRATIKAVRSSARSTSASTRADGWSRSRAPT